MKKLTKEERRRQSIQNLKDLNDNPDKEMQWALAAAKKGKQKKRGHDSG